MSVMSRYQSSESAERQAVSARATALRVKLWTVPRAQMGTTALHASAQNSMRHGLYRAAAVFANCGEIQRIPAQMHL